MWCSSRASHQLSAHSESPIIRADLDSFDNQLSHRPISLNNHITKCWYWHSKDFCDENSRQTQFQVHDDMLEGKGSLDMACCCFHRRKKEDLKKVAPNWRFYSLAHPFFITTLNCPSHLPPSYHQFYFLSPLASFSSSSLMPCTHPLHLFNTFLIFLFISPTSLTSPPPPVLVSFDFPLSTCPSLLASIHPPASILVLSLPGPWQW